MKNLLLPVNRYPIFPPYFWLLRSAHFICLLFSCCADSVQSVFTAFWLKTLATLGNDTAVSRDGEPRKNESKSKQ